MTPILFTALLTLSAAHADPAPIALTDGQVANVLVTINENELDSAKIALKRAKGSAAKSYAKEMKTAQEKNLKDTKDLAKKNKLGLDSSNVSKSIDKDAGNANKEIKKAKDADFDKAYLNEQVSLNQNALDTLNKVLIPATHDPELKRYLEATTKDMETQLDKAKAATAAN